MIAKNGIDWEAMGLKVTGECPEYMSHKSLNKVGERNITFTPAYKLWQRLVRVDRGQEILSLKDNLCEQWKDFNVFEKWYKQNYYEVEGDDMEFSYRFFDIYNTYISPETSCFLPKSINYTVKKLFMTGEKGLAINIMTTKRRKDNPKSNYVIRRGVDTLGVAYSDSKEEIVEIRKCMLRREFADLAEKYKKYLPEKIYNRLCNDDFYEVKNEMG